MREIEVKARVRDIDSLIENANKIGIYFGDPFIQDDTTYETNIPKTDPSWNIFRIRKQGDKVILTMKYKASTRSRDNHERESVIDNDKDIVDMLERVGYSVGVKIYKSRRTAKYNDLEICLDEVENLGSFIEVEKLAGFEADVDAVQSELWNVLLPLGVYPEDRIHDGYDTLIRKFLGDK